MPADQVHARADAPDRPALVGHADLWERIRAGFAMPSLDTPLVEEKERFYLNRPEELQRMFARGNRYLFHIVERIEERGLPTELALLPFVESAMNPEALSSARAAGLWQFIPSTGRAYNLRQDWWVDDRRDVVQSTEAALDYLEKIHALADNDWFLALASYNWGENAVARAIRRNQARGLPTGYLALDMPTETRNYVPKLLALKNIVLRAAQYGIELPPLPDEPYFVTVDRTRPMDLALAARFAGMSVPEFVALNPAHNRPVIRATGNNGIKLPVDRLERFLDAMERHRKADRTFASWQPYTLQNGETLASVARAAGTTEARLLAANDLRPGRRLLPGTRILVPQQDVDDESLVAQFDGPRIVELVHGPASQYRVQRGDTLSSIARRFEISVAQLRSWNRIGPVLQAGTTLRIGNGAPRTVLTAANGAQQVLSDGRAEVRPAVLTREDAAIAPRPASRQNEKTGRPLRTANPARPAEHRGGGVTGAQPHGAAKHSAGKKRVAGAPTGQAPGAAQKTAPASTGTRVATRGAGGAKAGERKAADPKVPARPILAKKTI